jgi:S-DNA-T family DNA segregation ATPase FtsK/SpoIIIE
MDTKGAEQLIGMGDMLISTGNDLTRLQCAFIDTPEVEKICEYIGSQRAYPQAHMLPEFEGEADAVGSKADLNELDSMFNEAASVLVKHQSGSTSLIQRKLRLGYNRAGSIIDQLEAAGIVGPFEGSKARKVLVKDEIALQEILENLNNE